MSGELPAGKATTMRTGRDGKLCAKAKSNGESDAAGNAAAPAVKLLGMERGAGEVS